MQSELLGAECRGCKLRLRGRSYCYGGDAYHPRTGERAKVNFYGGFVCSRECDYRASLELERTMPGHGYEQRILSGSALRSVILNWD